MKTNFIQRTKSNLIPALLLAGSMLTATAHAGTISILGEDGRLFSLDTTTGVATPGFKYVDPQSDQQEFSPNGLGVSPSGDVFFTTFRNTGNEDLYRNNTLLTTIPIVRGANIANGDVAGSNFHFFDRTNGSFYTVGNIFGTAGTQTVSSVSNIAFTPDFTTGTMGDLAIDGNIGYLSSGDPGTLWRFDLTTLVATSANLGRFVGLGFDGSSLYGVRREAANNYDLYRIDTTLLTAAKVADITGIPTTGGALGNYEITDAARAIPEPELPLLSLIGGLGMMMVCRKRH